MNYQHSLEQVRQYIDSGNICAAETLAQKLPKKKRGEADVLFLKGCIQFMKQNYPVAVKLLREVLKKDPGYIGARLNLGVALSELGELDKALICLKDVIAVSKDNFIAWYNLGNVYQKLECLPEAKEAYLQAIKLNPEYEPVYNNLGFVCYQQNETGDAIKYFRRAISFGSGDSAYVNLMALLRKKKSPQAYLHALEVIELPNPQNALLYAHTLLHESCKWDLSDSVLDKALEIARRDDVKLGVLQDILLTLNCSARISASDVFAIHRNWGKKVSRDCQAYSDYPNAFAYTQKLRIGLLSGDFRHHSVGLFIRHVIANYNHEQFEFICYSTGENHDDLTREIKSQVHAYIDVGKMPHHDLARRIHNDGIHILLDLAGHTTDTAVTALAYRPAPVQVTYLGYPNTTGLEEIDYRITDHYADVSDGTIYTEQCYQMPQSFLCFGSFEERPIRAEPPAKKHAYVTFGSFNNTRKLNPDVIRVWSEILHRTPGSKLLLKAGKLSIDDVRQNLLAEFSRHGITRERLILQAHVKAGVTHLDFYNQVDIALDTFPYNGTTTSCEALWMGVPVITLTAKLHAQRVTYSILKNMGIEETITFDEEAYIEKAVSLATDMAQLQQLRARIPAALRRSILCNPRRFTRQLEQAFREMWQAKGYALPTAVLAEEVVEQPAAGCSDEAGSENDLDRARNMLEKGDLEQAARCLQSALDQNPDDLHAAFLMGTLYYHQKKYEQSIALLNVVLQEDPDNLGANLNLGAALQETGSLDEAVCCYRKVLECDAQHHIALNNLGNILKIQGCFEEARGMLEAAVAAAPGYWIAHLNLGSVQVSLGNDQLAIECFRKALEMSQEGIVYAALMMSLKKTGELEEAGLMAVQAISLAEPGIALLPAYNVFTALCDWQRRDAIEASMVQLIQNKAVENPVLQSTLLALNSSPRLSRDEIYSIHCLWGERERVNYKRPYTHTGQVLHHKSRLRIAYLSPDFRKHSVGYFIANLLANHCPEKFEIYCYANSDYEDELTAKIRTHVHSYVKVKAMDGRQLAQRIHDDGIHILIDLAGHTTDSRMAVMCYRPAPVQISYLGYPNTTGLSTVDYRITDTYAEDPENGTLYTEELLIMPQSFLCFGAFEKRPITPQPPVLSRGYITFGSFNNLTKLTPDVVRVWSAILQQVPESRLMIKAANGDCSVARENILAEFSRHNIPQARIDIRAFFSETAAHLDFYNEIDIALDTFPYNGATTSCEALWMGVPVVTLVGRMHAQRVGYSILKNIGLDETISFSEDEYIATCVTLAGDHSTLKSLHERIPEILGKSILCDPVSFSRQFEDLLLTAWNNKYGNECGASVTDNNDQGVLQMKNCAEHVGYESNRTPGDQQQTSMIKPGGWVDVLQQYPYAGRLSSSWLQFMETHQQDEAWHFHQVALDYYAHAVQCEAQPDARGTALRSAYEVLFRLVNVQGNLSNLQSLSRIATELGELETARLSLQYLADGLEAGALESLDEPFLSVSPAYEMIDPLATPQGWVYAAVLEQLELLEYALSGETVGPDSQVRMKKLSATGLMRSEMSAWWQEKQQDWLIPSELATVDPYAGTENTAAIRKLHIGGKQEHPEWEILNAVPAPYVDHVGNARDLSRFADATFEEIYASHVLEHFAYKDELAQVLREWHRVLKPGGRLYISVPDLDKLAALVLKKDLLSVEQRFQVMRMIFGGQVDEYDYHKAGLNHDFLRQFLLDAGFHEVSDVDKFDRFDDTSDYRPYGYAISLNIIALK